MILKQLALFHPQQTGRTFQQRPTLAAGFTPQELAVVLHGRVGHRATAGSWRSQKSPSHRYRLNRLTV